MQERRDKWDKADIILKPVGGLMTALAVASLGFFGTRALDRRQAEDSKVKLYTELMGKREDTENAFRKELFNPIIGRLLAKSPPDYEQQFFDLELLSRNFSEDIDLSPIFNVLYRQMKHLPDREFSLRLEYAAAEVNSRQLAILEDQGGKLDGTINLEELAKSAQGMIVIEGPLNLSKGRATVETQTLLQQTSFKVEAIMVDFKDNRVQIKLEVRTPRQNNSDPKANDTTLLSSVFFVTPFDFPMVNSLRLPQGQRCSVVLRKFGNPTAQFTLVCFPENWRAARVVDMARILSTNP